MRKYFYNILKTYKYFFNQTTKSVYDKLQEKKSF